MISTPEVLWRCRTCGRDTHVHYLTGIVNFTIIVEVIRPHFGGKWGANPHFSRRKFTERSQMRAQWGKPIKRKM